MKKSMLEMELVELPVPAMPAGIAKRRRNVDVSQKSRDLMLMREILGMSESAMAAAIGINRHNLHACLYDKIEVTDDVMAFARSLVNEAGLELDLDRAREIEKRYAGMRMPAILASWADRMDISFNDAKSLAEALGCTASAISRWKNDKSRPRARGMLNYESRVETRAKS